MSSAAVQQTGPIISSRGQYQQPPHGRDQYYQQPAPAQSSPRNKSARPGGNGEPSTPQQSQHYSPSASNTSDMTTPRAQPASSSTQPSPVIASSPYNAHQGPVPPPRTSSTHRTSAQPVQDPYYSQRSTDERPPSSRTASQNMREDPASAAANAAQRRRQPSREQQPYQNSPSSSSRTKQTPTHSRSATAVGTPPMGSSLPREESTVINRLVVADPQEDIAREQARMADTRSGPTGADITPITGLGLVGNDGVDDGGRGAGKSRQDHSREKRRETKFGEYILGQTLGEGEFGKVKMGWKKDGGVQVAIKLIRREVLGSNPSRLPKIYREISILRGLQHPNIVRLHEMVETERHIGIILEYASGGELFDYILNHRYLKDNSARRLFAQLVSGVGYLHKKGIVHRDLKLENLLLDRNKNIIITDFGFANTFDPIDELGDEIEYNLGNKEFVKKAGLEIVGDSGHRRGDLMQTSCGSPCYAAPELVVSDSLYTGRKVDVWSCGVILYAMLAGYLPFDDDPANPEGDNINLLYKYIVSTPLTFPEYVTPHARDLLKRILVPDPRKRADLFEVARHSWLSEYAHVVGFITSSTTTSSDIANTTVPPEDPYEVPQLARSASVREASKQHTSVAAVGGLTQKHGHIDQTESPDKQGRRDAKRRTVQVEYVAPHTQTQRGGETVTAGPTVPLSQGGAQRSRSRDQGPVEVPSSDGYASSTTRQRRPSAGSAQQVPAAARQTREGPRVVADSPFGNAPVTSSARPSTGGTLGGSSRLPSRGNSYGQPVAATVAATNAQGRFSQPKGKQYVISAPMPHDQDPTMGQPSTQRMPSGGYQPQPEAQHTQRSSHKRSNTVGGIGEKIFRTSLFGGSSKPQKSYPPVSMNNSMNSGDSAANRKSTESSRRPSLSFSRKTSEGGRPGDRSSRRFSLLPASFSMKSFTGGNKESMGSRQRAPSRPQMAFGRGESPAPSQSTGNTIPVAYDDLDRRRTGETTDVRQKRRSQMSGRGPTSAPADQTQFQPQPAYQYEDNGMRQYPSNSEQGNYYHGNESDLSSSQGPQSLPYRSQNAAYDSAEAVSEPREGRARVLQKNRRFADAYEDNQKHAGSSGAARRVMDLFRRRGKARGG
ncbi:hypothetical protein SLS58_002562 [Diplodia intermedia]|uniref:Protein kinase domain-containing protein n=1 Tax=Diplodia intermedia TaxID=856260 RepID=A0ABR3TYT3_9PEZI